MGKLSQEEVSRRVQESFTQNVELISEYKSKRELVELHCLDCGHKWSTTAQNILYLSKCTKHACPNCGTQKNGQMFQCAYCGKEIYRVKSKIERNESGHFYCSTTCGNRHKNIIRESSGEWMQATSTYRRRALLTYEHKCAVCGWDEDERVLEVHHIDENREHNEVENLCILCPICHRKITLAYYTLTADFKLVSIS